MAGRARRGASITNWVSRSRRGASQSRTCVIILAGRISIRLDQGGIARIVKEWKTGDVSGYLPYSRLATAPGDVLADEPFEALSAERRIKDMTRECYEFTALCVHEMLDRARQFKSEDLLVQKLASLGVLSAGIAHELNNPSSAVARSAKELEPARAEVVSAARALGAALTCRTINSRASKCSTAPRTPRRRICDRRSTAPIGRMCSRPGLMATESILDSPSHLRAPL